MYHSLFPLIFYVLAISLEIESITRRYNYDAVLYEEYSIDSKSVQFSRTNKDLWKNISAVVESNFMMDKAMLCTRGRGSWIAFPWEDYLAQGLKYLLIVGETCSPAAMIRSLTPIGEMRKSMGDAVVMFGKPHFGGEQQTMAEATASMDVQSLAVFGGMESVIEGSGPGGAVKVCLKPTKDMNICILRDLDAALGMSGSKTIRNADCANDLDTKLVYLEMCYDHGVHTLKHNEDMSPKNIQSMCSGDVDQTVKNDVTLIMEIFEARVRRKLQSRPEISMPPTSNFKMLLLNNVLEVFKEICMVKDEYLNVLAVVFLQRMRGVWEATPEIIGHEDEKWKDMVKFLGTCKQASPLVGAEEHISATPCRDFATMPTNAQEGFLVEDMLNGETFDIVIDQMWMIFQLVTHHCNYVNEYDDNKWAEMTTMLKKYFLMPLRDTWREPGIWQRMYPTMFHGFDLEEEKKDIMSCVQNMVKHTSARDPVGRRSWADEFEDDFVNVARKIGK